MPPRNLLLGLKTDCNYWPMTLGQRQGHCRGNKEILPLKETKTRGHSKKNGRIRNRQKSEPNYLLTQTI